MKKRRHFSPYVCCVSGLLGKEAKEYKKRLAALLTKNKKFPNSVTCVYVNARMRFMILRATHLCIRGSRVPFRYMFSKQSQ